MFRAGMKNTCAYIGIVRNSEQLMDRQKKMSLNYVSFPLSFYMLPAAKKVLNNHFFQYNYWAQPHKMMQQI